MRTVPERIVRVLAGTSGFAYKSWKGSFYPQDIKADSMLRHYAERFPTVEINNTFYRMPSASVLLQWAAQVPEEFVFVLKAPQRITHHRRLKNIQELLGHLLQTSHALAEHLGPLLFQLPPNFKKDSERLRGFLHQLPAGTQAAFEFRHTSWFEEDVFATLRDYGAALCVADTDDGTPSTESTAPFGYLRLRRPHYDDAELCSWLEWVQRQAWERAFVFFKHDDEGSGRSLAARFQQLAQREGG